MSTSEQKDADTSPDVQIFSEKIRLLYSSTLTAVLALIVSALYILYLFSGVIPEYNLYAWIFYMGAIVVVRLVLFFIFRKTTSSRVHVAWNYMHIFIAASIGLGWGYAVYSFNPYLDTINEITLLVIVISYVSGALTTQFPSVPGFASMFYFSLLPLLYRLFENGDKLHNSLGIMLVIFALFVTVASIRLRKMLNNSLRLGYENISLAKDMEEKNIILTGEVESREEVQKSLVQAKGEAEKANQAKSDFLSKMSHELRTPMNAIIGFSQLLEISETLSEEDKDNVSEIRKAGDHLLGLINEILDLSRIESGKMELSIETVELGPLLDECLSLVAIIARKHAITLKKEIVDHVAVKADYTRLKQCILNLLSNAIKYNRPEGVVTLSVVSSEATLRINVTDTGLGISKEKKARLFKPFDRLNQDDSGIEGTGIGLTITLRLIEMMNGRVGVDSKPEVGSTFWIELPRAVLVSEGRGEYSDMDDPGSMAFEVIQAKENKKSVILYIEDNPANLRLVEKVLVKKSGVRLISAHESRLGIEIAKSQKPDLIILDINMPDMDGYQVLEALQGDSGLKDVPVIAVTANAMPNDIERGMVAGFREYLTKPLDVPHFYDVLDRLMKKEGMNEVV